MTDGALDDPILTAGGEEQDTLFELPPPEWQAAWQGMPTFRQEDLQPQQSVIVHLADTVDRERFARLVDQHIYETTRSIWYPKAEIGHFADRRYVTSRPIRPKYPIYVPTKGRWESALTIKALERLGVPYYAVIQPQEFESYRSVVKTGSILLLPAGLDGLVPARNWIRAHSIANGDARHWQIDDNIDGFFRLDNNLKVPCITGAYFLAMEDFSDRYENVAVSGPNYFMFASRKSVLPPLVFNTRIYSCSLVNNAMPHEWRGVYNDDTDLCLRVLKDGWTLEGGGRWSTVLFNAFLCFKATTMTLKGGNTPIYQGDGRLKMAQSLVDQHPDCVVVTEKWGRYQHHVDYRRFRKNRPILRAGIHVQEGVNDYGMHLEVDDEKPWERPLTIAEPIQPIAPTIPIQPLAVSALAFALRGTPEPATLPIERPTPTASVESTTRTDAPTELPGQSLAASARAFRDALAARGHRVLTRDGKLFVSEASRLTDEDRVTWQALRSEMFALAEPWTEPAQQPPTTLFAADAEAQPRQTLAEFLGTTQPRVDVSWAPDEPPDLTGVDEIVLNFATDGLDWAHGHRPVGVTVSTLDGQLTRFLPFRFTHGGNLDEAQVKRWAQEQLKGKKITNAKTKFDIHMAREWGVDLEAQGCRFSDIQHTAALLDDHRKRFGLDVLVADYFPDEAFESRVDESRHAEHHASEVATREKVTARLVGRLRNVMYPELDRQELRGVQTLEDDVIPAVVEMERNGSPLDVDVLDEYHAEANRRHNELILEVSRECGFAYDHTAKGWQRLFEALGLPPTEGNAEAIVGAIDHPTVKKAHLAAQYASLDSKTFKAYKAHVGADGILRFEINQLRSEEGGTVSGRFSIGYVQQVPNHDNHAAVFGEDLFPRRLFVPSEGDYLEADAMQIEQRLLVHYANNQRVIKEYEGDLERLLRGEEPISYHKVTWGMMKEYKPDMLYSHQKSFNFAFQYGARSIKLAVMMGFITEAEGDEIRRTKRWNDPRLKVIKEIEAAYKKMMPEGNELLDRASHLAKPQCDEYCKVGDKLHRQYEHRGYVKTLVGRRSRFPTNYKTYIGLNRVLQGTGADIMKRKLAELHAQRKHTGFVMRLTIHDAVGGDARLPETRARVSEILNAQDYPLKVPILWSTNVGKNWAACK